MIHVYPLQDLKDHPLSPDCWCRPEIEGELVIHNSMDRREEYEAGRRPS